MAAADVLWVCCPPAPPSMSGKREAGARDAISLAVFSAPITRPEWQILKNAPALSQNRPNVLLRNGEHPGSIGGKVMRRSLLAIVFGALAVGGMALAQHGGHGKGAPQFKVLSQ